MKAKCVMIAMAAVLFAMPGCAEKENDVDEGYKQDNVEESTDATGNEVPTRSDDTNNQGNNQGN